MRPSPQLKLTMCDCGNLHLTYRSLTLHFEKTKFYHFAEQVGRMATSISTRLTLPQTTALINPNGQNVH